jgi:TPP-dependent 2-oxoacid decarboxylase
MKTGIFLILLTFSTASFAQQYAEAFVLEIFDNYVKVVSPKKKSKNVSVVLLNKTLSKIYGKVSTTKKDLKFMAIEPKDTKTYSISGSGDSDLMFIPLSPTFQGIELVYGRKAYEIPEQK